MLNSFKYFKFTRKIGYNIFNSPKVVYISVNNRFKKRWSLFIKPLKTQSSLFWISKYYSSFRKQISSNYVCFFKRKRKKENSNVCQNLDFCLYKARFFKTIRQSRFFIKNKIVQVNFYTVNTPNYVLQEGDVVSLNWFFFSTIKTNMVNSFFSSNYKQFKTFVFLGFYFEISYSSGAFCYSIKIKLISFPGS